MVYKILQRLKLYLYYGFTLPGNKLKYRKFGNKSIIYPLLRLEHPENITIGRNVVIGKNTWLAASPNVISTPELIIEDRCAIGSMNQIYSNSKITLRKNVLTADRVYISDGSHDYENPNLPIMYQRVISLGEMEIGEGTWIGTNACILGVSVGKNCVIGSNSVVNRPIPDYCVAVGAPAKIIKRYCFESSSWRKTNPAGEFV